MLELQPKWYNKSPKEEALISFWKVNKKNLLKCTSYFTVPNPKKRKVLDANGMVVNKVLF